MRKIKAEYFFRSSFCNRKRSVYDSQIARSLTKKKNEVGTEQRLLSEDYKTIEQGL